ncbi:GPR1/FUN34/yaaH family-domain-containing protein [Triangularia verruculosa]|uniref:GPR1/FUN34/yaaH family-domain-containing protein n=1 Tax=Triangularia verruculosa TaxID=2587418 RepID=A0AAN7AUG9_9PEZI|nr:GPR1/FUN34/yaaH family-domain-containing protein [Triangularia verruculosa]
MGNDEEFEKLATILRQAQQPRKKNWGDPTPLALAGLVITLTPLSCQLMGWRGADPTGLANNGADFFLGGLLVFLSGIFEFFLGKTFASVAYCSLGGFFLALGATMTPGFSTEGPYLRSGVLGADFYASFGFFYLFTGVLTFVFFICALRLNICLVILFLSYSIAFPLLAAAEWTHAEGRMDLSHRLTVAGGASCFVVTMCAWWALIGCLLQSVGWSLVLPMGDLSHIIPGSTKQEDMEKQE